MFRFGRAIRFQSALSENGTRGSMFRFAPTRCCDPIANPDVYWIGSLIESRKGFLVSFERSCSDLASVGCGDACCARTEVATRIIPRTTANKVDDGPVR